MRARLEVQPERARRIRSHPLDELGAGARHVHERNVTLARRGARRVRILAVGVDEARAVEPAAHHGREQHRVRALRPHLVDEAHQVPPIVVRRRVVVRADLLVVVTELDEHVVARLHAVDDRPPAPLGDERPRAPPVHRAVGDAHLGGIEASLKRLAPSRLRPLVGLLLRHRRVTREPDGDRLRVRTEQREQQAQDADGRRHEGNLVSWLVGSLVGWTVAWCVELHRPLNQRAISASGLPRRL